MAAEQKDAGDGKEDYSDYSDTEEEEEEGDFKEMDAFVPFTKPRGRNISIMAASVSVAEDWRPPVYEKAEDEALMLAKRVGQNALMRHLGPKEIDILVNAFQVKYFDKQDVIIRQGDEGDLFYIIEEGQCEIFVEGVGLVMTIDGGEGRDFFGELALLYNAPRAATVQAATAVKSWTLDRITFKSIMQDSASKKCSLYQDFLDQVPLLSALTQMEKMTIADALKRVTYERGELIIRQGEPGNEFFIIEEGAVMCTKSSCSGVEEKVSDELGAGAYFGELALLNDDVRQASVRAVEQTVCLTLDRKTFMRVLGPLESILKQNEEMYEKYCDDAR